MRILVVTRRLPAVAAIILIHSLNFVPFYATRGIVIILCRMAQALAGSLLHR